MKIVLDCNIYDLLAKDENFLENLTFLIQHKGWEVLAPTTLVEELRNSPFQGTPSWINVKEDFDSVFVLGYTKLGSGRLGNGEIFASHKGNSKKVKDAIIVDFAVKEADIFVSEDKRARKRLLDMNVNIEVYDYNNFKNLTNQWSQ
jgi:hypothetical protein